MLGAAALLLFFAPLGVFLVVAIRVCRDGPIFMREDAVGLRGRPFGRWRFSRAAGQDTVFDRFVEQAGLSCLPSVFNVMAGEMSLIGPAPHSPDRYAYLRRGHSDYMRRFEARPGMIGPGVIDERASLGADLDYVLGWSALLDLKVACRFAIDGLLVQAQRLD